MTIREAQIRTLDRVIVQVGSGLGERADCAIVALSDVVAQEIEAAMAQVNGGVTLADDGTVTALPIPQSEIDAANANANLRQQILDLAQSAVGVSLSALTAAQRNALTACLLWKAGGVTTDMKVKPLGQWLNGG